MNIHLREFAEFCTGPTDWLNMRWSIHIFLIISRLLWLAPAKCVCVCVGRTTLCAADNHARTQKLSDRGGWGCAIAEMAAGDVAGSTRFGPTKPTSATCNVHCWICAHFWQQHRRLSVSLRPNWWVNQKLWCGRLFFAHCCARFCINLTAITCVHHCARMARMSLHTPHSIN